MTVDWSKFKARKRGTAVEVRVSMICDAPKCCNPAVVKARHEQYDQHLCNDHFKAMDRFFLFELDSEYPKLEWIGVVIQPEND